MFSNHMDTINVDYEVCDNFGSRGTSRDCSNATIQDIQYRTNGASLDASQTKQLNDENGDIDPDSRKHSRD